MSFTFFTLKVLSDKERLVKRTQLKRSAYRVLGKPEQNQNVATPEAVKVIRLFLVLYFLCSDTRDCVMGEPETYNRRDQPEGRSSP